MNRVLFFLLTLALGSVLSAHEARAQEASYGTGAGVALQLSNDGFGLGGIYRKQVSPGASFFFEGHLSSARDAREQQFSTSPFGDTVAPLKRHFVLVMPLHAGLEQRLFRERVRNTLRPFVQVAAGPTLAYQWAYFDDANANGLRDEGEERLDVFDDLFGGDLRLGLGGTLALGAFFGKGTRNTQGLRIGYTGAYFFEAIDFLEPRPSVEGGASAVERPSSHFVGTPVVSLYIMRLF